jgi:glycosyltransferase involved in cell wall biosynthesis
MITVLNVIDTGGPGGAETVFLNICAGLDPTEFRSISVVSREGWLADSLRARGATPWIIPSRGSLSIRYLRQIMHAARSGKADVIAGHLYGSAVYCSLAGKLLGIPVVSVLHGQSDIAKGGRFPGLKKFLVRTGTKRLVFVSDRLRQDLTAALRVSDEQCAVIPNGVDIDRFSGVTGRPLRTELGLQGDQILVGAVGNIRSPKAYDVFLRAAKLLKDHSPRYRFAIAGEGSGKLYDEMLTLRRELDLEREVTFLGLRSDVAEILHSLDVYVLSSTTEGFSIACVEAMAAGTPVVATRSGGPEEIVEHERSGLLVPTQNPRAVADAVRRFELDSSLASELTANALKRVQRRYTLSSMLRAYEQLFRDTVAGNESRGAPVELGRGR